MSERDKIVEWLEREADQTLTRAAHYGERGIYNVAEDYQRQALHDRARADMIERGEHLKRPSPTIAYEQWKDEPSVGYPLEHGEVE